MSFSIPGAFLALLVQGPAQRALRPGHQEPRPFIYYDYVENGELRGGRVAVDPTNPLHVDLRPDQRVGTDPVTTLVNSGPTSNRIDMVFVGDGYTSGELATYAADVDDVWPAFFGEKPFSNYVNYFNIHRVDVTSLESGVDNDPTQGIQKQTALDMGYWCGGTQRLLCVDVGLAINHASSAPEVDSILALANSGTYGGAGYSSLSTLSGHNGSAIEIALHEYGHSFAGLADEYDIPGATYTGSEPSFANVSIHDEAALQSLSAKWYRWLDLASVGAFEGALFNEFGIYRPTNDSKMRSLDRPFQQVNNEQLVRTIYTFVNPIDDATPPGSYPLYFSFFVDPMDPVGHALTIQWSLDGNAIPGATSATFDAASLALSSAGAPYTLSVEVVDNTTMVRDPAIRSTWMTETRSWTLRGSRHVRPSGVPIGIPLVLDDTPRPDGTLWFDIPADRTARDGCVALLFISQSSRPQRAALGNGLQGCLAVSRPNEGGSSFRFEIAPPDDAALAERTFYAQAALFDPAASRGNRLVWTSVLEFVLER